MVNMIPIALQQQVEQQLQTKLRLANQQLTRHYPLPQLNYQQTGTIAGSAHYAAWLIKLNGILLLENSQAFIEQVIPHELAHLLTFAEFGQVAPHGKQWRWMMEQILQVPAKRTHHFAIDNVKRRHYQRFSYHCQCQTHQLTRYRHQRILLGQVCYHCRRCKSPLRYLATS